MHPFWVTGLFLYQFSAAESLGWTAGLIASAFIAFALSRIMAGIMTGPMIDRFSARSLFPFMVFPMVAGLVSAWVLSGPWVASLYMGLVWATMGIGSRIKASLFAVLDGRNL